MIKQWNVASEWQEPFVAGLRARGASPEARDAALGTVDDACTQKGSSAQELFGDPQEYAKTFPLEEGMTAKDAAASRTRAFVLAIAGLVGMFFTLLGWTGHVRHVHHVWGADPSIWITLGLIVVVAAAIADAVLGRRADFTQSVGRPSATATIVNRLLPWLILLLTGVGMVVVSLTHG